MKTTIDRRIELSRFQHKLHPWEAVVYDPRSVESSLHYVGGSFDNPVEALKAATAYLENLGAQRFVR